MDSIFRVLEPVGDKINERVKAAAGFGSRLGFRSTKSEWFRVYRDFFLPSDSFDVIFLKARIAILCAKGFEIMNLQEYVIPLLSHDGCAKSGLPCDSFGSITLPQKEDPKHAQTIKRCENARPIGMFRSTDEEFLLCYDGLFLFKKMVESTLNAIIQSLASMSTNMVTLVVRPIPLNGRELLNAPHSILLMCFCLTLALSKSDT